MRLVSNINVSNSATCGDNHGAGLPNACALRMSSGDQVDTRKKCLLRDMESAVARPPGGPCFSSGIISRILLGYNQKKETMQKF